MRTSTAFAAVLSCATAATLYAYQATTTSDEQEVLAAQRRLTEAQATCALDVMNLRMRDHTIISPTGEVLTGESVLRENDARCRKTKPTQREDVRVRVYNGNTAVITGSATMFRPDGTARPTVRFTSVWIKSDGQWRHASFQTTTISSRP